MNWRHFSAFLWLRYRIRLNQLKRAGIVNTVITIMFVVGLVPGSALLCIGAALAGALAVPQVPAERLPAILAYIWDGILVVFLFAWAAGLIAELQRSEALSLNQFLHLPVSLSGVFVINYLSSLVNVTMLVFVPAMLGFVIGLSIGVNPLMLLLLPAVAAFVFAVTALSYQFQGWLATLMANPRRRRTILVTSTMVMVLLIQIPNLINLTQPWNRGRQPHLTAKLDEETTLSKEFQAGQIEPAEYQRRHEEIQKKYQQAQHNESETIARVEAVVGVLNYALPPLWPALGAGLAAEGNPLPALLATLGLGLIGTASLWRGYHTTMRLYTGAYTGAPHATPAPALVPAPVRRPLDARPMLLERRLPRLSERSSAIALASFRAIVRAPEAKMLLLSPLFLVMFFGAALFSGAFTPPVIARPFIAFGGISFLFLGMGQLVGNQFGFDRNGFRLFVLCPAARREILLGKNLAYAPLSLGVSLLTILIIEILTPLRPDHLVLLVLLAVSMYLLYCLLANMVSILAPMAVAANALRPVKPSGLQLLMHLSLGLLYPLVMVPLLVPLGVDLLVEWLEWPALPIGLLLMLVECGLVVLLYRVVLGWQGKLLQAREQKILEIVTAKAE